MPSKAKIAYVCSECGFDTPRWFGKCPECGEWNTLTEFVEAPAKKSGAFSVRVDAKTAASTVTQASDISEDSEISRDTGMPELNRVLGGGIVDGSVILLSGDPGVGKSTLLLQVCKNACTTRKVLYIAGEESPRQIKSRASRIGLSGENLYIAQTTDVSDAVGVIYNMKPDIVMVDSIQTMNHPSVSSPSGSVSQVRECTQAIIHAAKDCEIPVFLVGHVNKDGGIAGPKVLEHMVDVVLYFEGEKRSSYRILRAVKNRYGSTNEIGVFEMDEGGLRDVENPSLMLLSGRPAGVSGTCAACVMEGSRPILAEVQALVSKTAFGTPRRVATGFDFNRAALLIAVLEKRGGYFFGNLDAYINIIGGLRLDEPAADLPVALALVSNLLDRPVPDSLAAFGEIGLGGEIRTVSHVQQRVNECARLGFTKIITPKHHAGEAIKPPILENGETAKIIPVNSLTQAVAAFSI